MPAYDVTVSVTSSPFNAGIKIGGLMIYLGRDENGNWAGSRGNLKFSGDTSIEFRATGISGSAWTLDITFTPKSKKDPIAYKHNDSIPDDGLSILLDTVRL